MERRRDQERCLKDMLLFGYSSTVQRSVQGAPLYNLGVAGVLNCFITGMELRDWEVEMELLHRKGLTQHDTTVNYDTSPLYETTYLNMLPQYYQVLP